jgi:chromosome partitioning protein
MITTIFNPDKSAERNAKRTILAINLALSGTLARRKTALIDATATATALNWNLRRSMVGVKPKLAVLGAGIVRPELGDTLSPLRRHYRDIIIDTDGVDSINVEAALVASNVLVVPTWAARREAGELESLVQPIENVRLFNPSLRVLVVALRRFDAERGPDAGASAETAALVQSILGARLAQSMVHDWLEAEQAFEAGTSMLDGDVRNERVAAEIDSLRLEIQRAEDFPMPAASGIALTNAIHRIMQKSYAPVPPAAVIIS